MAPPVFHSYSVMPSVEPMRTIPAHGHMVGPNHHPGGHQGWATMQAPPIDPSCMPALQPLNPQQMQSRPHNNMMPMENGPMGSMNLVSINESMPRLVSVASAPAVTAADYSSNGIPMTRTIMMMPPKDQQQQQQQQLLEQSQIVNIQSPIMQTAITSRPMSSSTNSSVAPSPSGSLSSPVPLAYDGVVRGHSILADGNSSDGGITFEMDPSASLVSQDVGAEEVKREGD